MSNLLQRKYIDRIRSSSFYWANWDQQEIQVGSYGEVDKETGKLIVEGNIYDPEFQTEMFKHNAGIRMLDYPPRQGPVKDDIIITSEGVECEDMDKDVDAPGVADAFVKGKWTFEHGKRGAVLILHKPREFFLPPDVVLEPLHKVDKLMDKWLVTSMHMCPAYSMCLSDKSGGVVSLALVSETPTPVAGAETEGANSGLTWWADAPSGLLRSASDPMGKYTFTPIYNLLYPIKRNRRFFRDRIMPEPTGDEFWYAETPPWDPLTEDGEEDPLDPRILAVDPFAAVNQAAAERAAAEKLAEERAAEVSARNVAAMVARGELAYI